MSFFIETLDNITCQFYNVNADNFQNKLLFSPFINKLHGAKDGISIACVTTIAEIPRELIRNFSDHRNEASFIFDLHNVFQGSDSPLKFYNPILEVLSTLSNYLSLHDTSQNKIIKMGMYTFQALKIFLEGLLEQELL